MTCKITTCTEDAAVEGLCKKIRRELALHKAAAKAADVDELD
jgi:hypothetical protein